VPRAPVIFESNLDGNSLEADIGSNVAIYVAIFISVAIVTTLLSLILRNIYTIKVVFIRLAHSML